MSEGWINSLVYLRRLSLYHLRVFVHYLVIECCHEHSSLKLKRGVAVSCDSYLTVVLVYYFLTAILPLGHSNKINGFSDPPASDC